jgi:hypothetical protein
MMEAWSLGSLEAGTAIFTLCPPGSSVLYTTYILIPSLPLDICGTCRIWLYLSRPHTSVHSWVLPQLVLQQNVTS